MRSTTFASHHQLVRFWECDASRPTSRRRHAQGVTAADIPPMPDVLVQAEAPSACRPDARAATPASAQCPVHASVTAVHDFTLSVIYFFQPALNPSAARPGPR